MVYENCLDLLEAIEHPEKRRKYAKSKKPRAIPYTVSLDRTFSYDRNHSTDDEDLSDCNPILDKHSYSRYVASKVAFG